MNPFIEYINDCGEAFVGSAGLMLIQSSVLIAILFGLDFVLRKRMRAVFRYSLWMLILVKLVLPSNLSMPFSLGYWLGDTVDRVERSLPSPADASYALVDGVGESWPASVETAIDEPTERMLPAHIESNALFAFDGGASTHSTEDASTGRSAGSYGVRPESRADIMEVVPPVEVDMARNSVVALSWRAILFGLWLVVCTGAGLMVLQRTLLVQRLTRQADRPDDDLVELFECCIKRMRIGRDVGLCVSPLIPTPAVCGLFRPVVLIPERMSSNRLGTDELEAIFIHELAHIQRDDLWVKLLQTILQVVYFYNPLIWLANATIRRVREQAVDETVLVTLGEPARQVYPRALLKVAGWVFDRPAPGLRLVGVMESKGLLTERIKIMLDKSIPRSKRIGIIGLAALVLLGAFLLPMARADKRDPVAIPEPDTVSIVAEDVVGTVDVLTHVEHAEAASLELRPVEVEPVDAAGSSMSRSGYSARSGIQKARVEIAKDTAEIEAIKLQIKSMQQQIQMKINMLLQKKVELEKMQADLEVAGYEDYVKPKPPIRPRRRTSRVSPSESVPPLNNPPRRGRMMGAHAGSHPVPPPIKPPSGGGDMMMGALSLPVDPVAEPSAADRYRRGRKPVRIGDGISLQAEGLFLDTSVKGKSPNAKASQPTAGASALGEMRTSEPQKNVSDEVRKELQRILPGLLREILPKLLDEAMAEAAGNNDLLDEDGYPRGMR